MIFKAFYLCAAELAAETNTASQRHEALQAAAYAQVALREAELGQSENAIARALEKLQDELEEAGLIAESIELEPDELLSLVFTRLHDSIKAQAVGNAALAGVSALAQRLDELTGIAEASDNPASQRQAVQSRALLEEVDRGIKSAMAEGTQQ